MQLLNDLSLIPEDEKTAAGLHISSNIKINLDRSAADLLGLGDNDFGDFMSAAALPYMPSQLLLNDLVDMNSGNESTTSQSQIQNPIQPTDTADTVQNSEQKQKNSILDLFQRNTSIKSKKSDLMENSANKQSSSASAPANKPNMEKNNRKSKSKWFDDLFSDLDPLANPELNGNNSNCQSA